MLSINRKAVSVLSAGHACVDLCQGAVPALLPTLIVQRHLSYTSAASLVFAATIASSIIQPVFGHTADRFRMSWLMPFGVLLAGIGLALASIAPSYALIALCVCLSGIGVAAFHPEAARRMHEEAGKQKATGMSLFSLGGNIGFALGPLLTTALLVLLGLSGTYLLIIPLAIVALLLVYFGQGKKVAHEEKIGQGSRKGKRSDDWWAFARLTMALVLRSMVFYGLNTFIPLYWIAVLHQSQAASGFALSVMLFVGLTGTLLGGWFADRIGRRRVILIVLGLLFPCLLLFILLSPLHPLLALVLLAPVGMTLFAPTSIMVVMGQEYLPNHVGTASGVTLGLAVTVGGVTAPLMGRVADSYGISVALLGLTLLPLLAAICVFSLPRVLRPVAAP